MREGMKLRKMAIKTPKTKKKKKTEKNKNTVMVSKCKVIWNI